MKTSQTARLFRRYAALACLFSFFLGQSRVVPLLFATAASVEGSHTVNLGGCGETMKIVLSHERGNFGRPDYQPSHDPRCASHSHGLAAQMFCFLSSSRNGPEDHVACFASDLAEDDDDLKKASRPGAGLMPDVFSSVSWLESLFLSVPGVSHPATPGDSSPPIRAHQRCLRSTCLLI